MTLRAKHDMHATADVVIGDWTIEDGAIIVWRWRLRGRVVHGVELGAQAQAFVRAREPFGPIWVRVADYGREQYAVHVECGQ